MHRPASNGSHFNFDFRTGHYQVTVWEGKAGSYCNSAEYFSYGKTGGGGCPIGFDGQAVADGVYLAGRAKGERSFRPLPRRASRKAFADILETRRRPSALRTPARCRPAGRQLAKTARPGATPSKTRTPASGDLGSLIVSITCPPRLGPGRRRLTEKGFTIGRNHHGRQQQLLC